MEAHSDMDWLLILRGYASLTVSTLLSHLSGLILPSIFSSFSCLLPILYFKSFPLLSTFYKIHFNRSLLSHRQDNVLFTLLCI